MKVELDDGMSTLLVAKNGVLLWLRCVALRCELRLLDSSVVLTELAFVAYTGGSKTFLELVNTSLRGYRSSIVQ